MVFWVLYDQVRARNTVVSSQVEPLLLFPGISACMEVYVLQTRWHHLLAYKSAFLWALHQICFEKSLWAVVELYKYFRIIISLFLLKKKLLHQKSVELWDSSGTCFSLLWLFPASSHSVNTTLGLIPPRSPAKHPASLGKHQEHPLTIHPSLLVPEHPRKGTCEKYTQVHREAK